MSIVKRFCHRPELTPQWVGMLLVGGPARGVADVVGYVLRGLGV